MFDKKLLIVEDSAIVVLDLKSKLTKLGYSVVDNVFTGEDAVDTAGKVRPNLVLMDIMLAGKMDGINAADIITQRLDIPVLFMSAYSDTDTIERAKKINNYGFLVKPFDERDLFTTIEMALERSRFDRRLRDSERKYRELFEDSKDPVCILDPDWNIVDLNTALVNLFGYRREELFGTPLYQLFFNKEEITNVMEAISSGGFVMDLECMMKKKDNTEISCVVTTNSQRKYNGSIKSYQCIIRDITRRKEAEAEVQRSYSTLQKTMFDVIQAISLAVESRDPYTAGHQRRVSELAYVIAKIMKLPEKMIMGIRLAAMIHDLGKISIPAEILSKPRKLTVTEFKLIKTHPEVGYNILKDINFPWPIKEIVLQHHERIDGSGYPAGLVGEEILLEARIIAVADVVEAMASHRPYRPAKGLPLAMDEIRQNSGKTYDSVVADACIFSLNEKGEMFKHVEGFEEIT